MRAIQAYADQEMHVSVTSSAHAKAVELGKYVIRMTSAAGSGHPSSGLALAHIIVELMYRRMRYDPTDPWNPASDRLVLSIGHAVPIVYAAYADLGGAVGTDRENPRLLRVDDLHTLRELSSVLDGHPNPAEGFPFFDAATGSLGQGLSVAAGLALAAGLDRINKRIFVVAGDGESREGQVWEAMDFIAERGLRNVCVIFSCNGHGQAGPVSHQQDARSISAKAAAFGFHVVGVDGHDPNELSAALDQIATGERPLAVVARTVKGWGVESIQKENYHGRVIPASSVDRACAELDATSKRVGATISITTAPPAPPVVLPRRTAGAIALPAFDTALKVMGWEKALAAKKLATRAAYGVALASLGDADERIVVLDGDVSNSTYAELFAKRHAERFFECKIAEQNMISVAVGLAATGKIPFASSFAKFIARAVDQIDMAGITRANIKIAGSHAGVSLAADGPSQMSLADTAYFRSMTRAENGRGGIVCHVFHPSDAVSAYRCTELMANIEGMCYVRTHRPEASFIYPFEERFEVRGCKQLLCGKHLTIASCGYMLHTALEAAARLAARGIECNVFDAYTFPLDPAPILTVARESGGTILTVEDNYIGGLHAELAEAAAELGNLRVVGMTVRRLPKSAKTPGEVFTHVGVGLEHIITRATVLARREV